ncbi:TonB-dependent receptor [Cupriavidus basilensis]|uniref:Outer membrane receptor protein, mostly Fe transport n=1 Tax=Cupriavidus basilensis TaxID=68895 RepID=A0A0C4YIE2_9BURK|nr:TonB-dependent receptor [Cupriavidus basilensis]AJG22783.1 Outer membrane receptor protein, mostly Fe transport [Cupriavidus basilensis]
MRTLLPLVILGTIGTLAEAADEQSLPAVQVTETRSFAEKNQLPQTTASITGEQAAQAINVMGAEDALKYLPDVLVRKRFIGDTQSPMATRTTGINASARSLIYADGVLLSTLINNNNGNGSPQWFMVTPQSIDRVDVMYGPFAAAYPGNSYGAVTEITTRMPKTFEGNLEVTGAIQQFSKYGTDQNEPAQQVGATLGDRTGKFSWWFSANHLNSFSQPLSFATVGQSTAAAGAGLPVITGAYADRNRTGGAIQVIGAGNFIHTLQDNATVKLGYDFTPTLSAVYTLGYWQNSSKASAQTYLSTTSGSPFYGASGGNVNIGGFAYSASTIAGQFSSNNVDQEHLMQSLKVGTRTQGLFDWEAIVSNFYYLQDSSRLSTGLYPAALTGGPGRTTDMSGSGWSTLDVKGIWRPQGIAGANIVSFGAHYDQFKLSSPTYSTTNWVSGGNGALFSTSQGKTQTGALWLQDVWRMTPSLQATLGGRYEMWRAHDGFNYAIGSNGVGVPIQQPSVDKSGFSPKTSLTWEASQLWSVTGSFGKALRFPTVGELYQSVQTGTTFTQANPFLQPERVLSGELAIERHTSEGKLRVSAFSEYVRNALISQTSTIAGFATPVSFTQNVGKTRQLGLELAGQQDHVLINGLTLSGNVTYVNSRILSDDSYVPTTPGATAVGKRVPYVPTWRGTVAATYRPDNKWAYTLAARYSSRVYATVDNTDINPATYQGFESFFVMDARMHYQLDKHWSGALGVDNLNNHKYFLFHPFPQRTFYLSLKYTL